MGLMMKHHFLSLFSIAHTLPDLVSRNNQHHSKRPEDKSL